MSNKGHQRKIYRGAKATQVISCHRSWPQVSLAEGQAEYRRTMCAPCTVGGHGRAHRWLFGLSCWLKTGSDMSCRNQGTAEILEKDTVVEFAVMEVSQCHNSREGAQGVTTTPGRSSRPQQPDQQRRQGPGSPVMCCGDLKVIGQWLIAVYGLV